MWSKQLIRRSIFLFLMMWYALPGAFAQSDSLTYHVMIGGAKYWVDRIDKRVKMIDGKPYALVEDRFYPLEYQPPRNNPYTFEFFVTLDDGSRFYITRNFYYRWHMVLDKPEQAKKFLSGRALPSTGPIYPEGKVAIEREITYDSFHPMKRHAIKVTPERRIILDDEFQSYKGNFIYVKRIDAGPYALDTIIIKPPSKQALAAVAQHKIDFAAQVGEPVKPFDITDLKGELLSSDSLRGKVVVINFWFIGCPPCQREIPELNELVTQYEKQEDVVFLGFATDKKKSLERFLGRKQFKYRIIPESMGIAEDFLVSSYPAHFVVDKTGITRFAHLGFQDDTIEKLKQAVNQSLEQ